MRSIKDKKIVESSSCKNPLLNDTVKKKSINPINKLHQEIGNNAVKQLLESNRIQAKLTVGPKNDKYEREADRIADQVVEMPEPLFGSPGALIEDASLSQSEQSETISRKVDSTANGVPDTHQPDIDSTFVKYNLGSQGEPLSLAERKSYEPRFGYDFSRVRIHTNARAAETALSINARAFTIGNHIAFAPGEFTTHSKEGKRLLAHELSHVVQQRSFAASNTGDGLIQRVASDPVAPVLTQIILSAGVGRSKTNNVADVRLIQDRLLVLNYLSVTDHGNEAPAAGATGAVAQASLAATIAAIELFQSEVQGHVSPDGAVDRGGGTLRQLNSSIARQTAADFTTVSNNRAAITETVTRGVSITAAVGNLADTQVIAGAVNRPADVTVVQNRLIQLGYLNASHGEDATANPVATAIVLTDGVGRGHTNNVSDVRAVQDRLLTLGHLTAAGHTAESPTAAAGTVAVAEGNLVATISAIEAFQEASGFITPDGAIDTGGLTLGYLNTDSVPSRALANTKNAIRRFQQREVRFWRSRGTIAGTITNKVINPGDATIDLLNRIGGFREQFTTGEDIQFRDFTKSRFTRTEVGTSVIGNQAPSALAQAEFTAVGLTPAQTEALRFVSSHEGNFDALNTFDVARVSFGFIQFAGGRGLPPFMALLKSRKPEAFASMFQTYGIDVEFNVVNGNIQNAVVVVIDPSTNNVLRGIPAEEVIRDSQRLSAVFIRAGSNIDVQRVQIEAATRDYLLPALARSVSFTANIIEVLDAPGGAVTATHAGAAARAFRATPAFATLNAAARIHERTAATSAATQALLNSEQGVGVLLDRNIQEGNTLRIREAMRWVADQKGLTDIAGVAAFETEVLQQVVDDFTADIDISGALERARVQLAALFTVAGARGATVAGVLALAQVASARTEVDNAIAMLPDKSPDSSRRSLEAGLPTQRTRLNFLPVPASIAALRRLITDIRVELNRLKPDRNGNAAGFRRRVQRILASTLGAP